MSAAYQAALRGLSLVLERLRDPLLTEAERALTMVEFDRVLASLRRQDYRTSTQAMAKRVQQLDAQLQDRQPAERNQILMQRLGISRSRLYELRSIPVLKTSDGRAV